MIPVAIEYRPSRFFRWQRTVECRMPAHWYELTPRQLEAVVCYLLQKSTEDHLLRIMLGVRRSIFRMMSSYEKFVIFRNLQYIEELDSCNRFIIERLGRFHAPGPRLQDVTFGAFIFGDTYFQDYLTAADDKRAGCLNRFIACFYLKGKFSDKEIERNARRISHVSLRKRMAIAKNYTLIREWLARAYPNVFQKVDEKSARKAAGWVAVFDAVVGDDVVNSERYAQMPLSTVLRFLNRKTKEYLKNGKV